MFKKLKVVISTSLILSLSMTGSVFAENYKKVKIDTDILNVRESNTTDSKKVSRLGRGQEIEVMNVIDNWYEIRLNDESHAFISSDYCEVINDYVGGKINKPLVNFREKPSTGDTKIISKLHEGDELQLLSKDDDWYKAVDADGNEGYVFAELVTLNTFKTALELSTGLDLKQNKLIQVGKAQLGKPYVWAAQGPNAFDCSGFVQYVFKKAVGKDLPHSSRTMSTTGTTIKKANLKAGDLVFFKTGGSSSINHTGIYIGNGEFIHASSANNNNDSVVISKLNEGYYAKVYAWAKRLD